MGKYMKMVKTEDGGLTTVEIDDQEVDKDKLVAEAVELQKRLMGPISTPGAEPRSQDTPVVVGREEPKAVEVQQVEAPANEMRPVEEPKPRRRGKK